MPKPKPWERVVPFVMGLWLALVFAKFGNPVIFWDQFDSPRDIFELIMDSWPIGWGYGLLGVALLCALPVWRWNLAVPKWVLILPLVWFGWQLLSARLTVNGRLTQEAVLDFGACTACFYVGLFALGRLRNGWPLWGGLLLGLLFCLWSALGQHFGGLEQTRRYLADLNWNLYPPEMKAKLTSPEFQQKIASNRIFGTFVYPNALAGGIILALPASLLAAWNLTRRLSFVPRGVIFGVVAYAGLACLFWSGSKAGWLIMLGMGLVALLHLEQLASRLKWLAVAILLAVGLVGFYGKHSGYFARKTNSATARLDYWQAAWTLLKEKPLFGSGPGTFKVGYQRLKPPEAEPAKLAHNDYLQQGSDSGIVGLCSYLALIAGSVAGLYRRIRKQWDWLLFVVWLGVAGLAVQELVEFSLYIPALAWPFFLFLGWLWGRLVPQEGLRPPSLPTPASPCRMPSQSLTLPPSKST